MQPSQYIQEHASDVAESIDLANSDIAKRSERFVCSEVIGLRHESRKLTIITPLYILIIVRLFLRSSNELGLNTVK